jgi:hypothetical protein
MDVKLDAHCDHREPDGKPHHCYSRYELQDAHCDHHGPGDRSGPKNELQDDHCDHHELGDHCDPKNVLPDAHRALDDLLHVPDDRCAVGARNHEQDVHCYGIQLPALAYPSSQSHYVHRYRYYHDMARVHALDNLGDLGYELVDRHRGRRGYGFLAYVNSRASLAQHR